MKLTRNLTPEIPHRMRTAEAVLPPEPESTDIVNVAEVARRNLPQFLLVIQGDTINPFVQLGLLEQLRVVDPSAFAGLPKNNYTFEQYQSGLELAAVHKNRFHSGVGILIQFFPDHAQDIKNLFKPKLESFLENQFRPADGAVRASWIVAEAQKLLYIFPERQAEIRQVGKPFADFVIQDMVKGTTAFPLLTLQEVVLVDPALRPTIQKLAKQHRAGIVRDLQTYQSANDVQAIFFVLSILAVIQADQAEIMNDSRLVLTKEKKILRPSLLPERDLAA